MTETGRDDNASFVFIKTKIRKIIIGNRERKLQIISKQGICAK